jgi:hypothetical protein
LYHLPHLVRPHITSLHLDHLWTLSFSKNILTCGQQNGMILLQLYFRLATGLPKERFKFPFFQVNVPKQRNTYCKRCKHHTLHRVSQYKQGAQKLVSQGIFSRLRKASFHVQRHFPYSLETIFVTFVQFLNRREYLCS